jgi:hypothetical protein
VDLVFAQPSTAAALAPKGATICLFDIDGFDDNGVADCEGLGVFESEAKVGAELATAQIAKMKHATDVVATTLFLLLTITPTQ